MEFNAKIMEFSHIYKTLLVLLTVHSFSFSQIESGKVNEGKKNEKKVEKTKVPKVQKVKEKKEFVSSTTNLEIGINLGMGYRDLAENKTIFGKPLGSKTEETPLFVNGYNLGIRSQLNTNFHLHFGFSLVQTGEQYRFEKSDTLSAYQHKYTSFAVPIGIQYVVGEKIRFVAGIGLQPQLLAKTSTKSQFRDAKNAETSSSSSNKKGMQFFTLGSYLNFGIEYQLSQRISIYLMPEIRYNLTNTFGKQEPYVHKGQFFGAQFGISIGVGE